jgi:hypothetical protein
MIETKFSDDRKEMLKLITIGVCILEIMIAICTFFYQQDTQTRTEIPISEEMARIYIDHPEKLKENEKLAYNVHSVNQKGYMLITNEIVRHSFPWKGWILLSIGVPVALAFIIVLVAKAYCQVAERSEDEKKSSDNKWIDGLNTLSRIQNAWVLLMVIGAVLCIWFMPEAFQYVSRISVEWLSRFWWIPVMICVLFFLLVALWFYFQFRLKMNAMQMNMEFEKMKYLQGGQPKDIAAIGLDENSTLPMIENQESE